MGAHLAVSHFCHEMTPDTDPLLQDPSLHTHVVR